MATSREQIESETRREIYEAISYQRRRRLAQVNKDNTGAVVYGIEIALATILAMNHPEMGRTDGD